MVKGRIGRKTGQTKDYGVSILGFGRVGAQSLENIINISEVGKINIVSSRGNEVENRRVPVWINNGIKLEHFEWSSLRSAIATSDISIISACNNIEFSPYDKDRDKHFLYNREIIERIARVHKEGKFDGTALIVTNPTDELSYLFAVESGINPLKIIGMNHLDTKRFNAACRKTLQEHTGVEFKMPSSVKAYIVGPHNEKIFVPVISKVCIVTKEEESSITDFLTRSYKINEGIPIEEAAEKARNEIRGFVKETLKAFKDTSYDTGKAVGDVVRAIINEEDIVEVSVYNPEEDVYIGWPSYFENFYAIPLSNEEIGKHPFSDSEEVGIRRFYGFMQDKLKGYKLKGRIKSRETLTFQSIGSNVIELSEERDMLKAKSKRQEGIIQELKEEKDGLENELKESRKKDGETRKIIERIKDLEDKIERGLDAKKDDATNGSLEELYLNSVLDASRKGRIWYGYKHREYKEGHDKSPSRGGMKEKEPVRGNEEFELVKSGTYKVLIYHDNKKNPKNSFWQLYQKVSPTNFRAIYHTNNETFIKGECECFTPNCTGCKGHVDRWEEGVAPEILELAKSMRRDSK